MITIAEIAEEIIRKSPFLEEALADGLINVSSLARMIKPDIEKKLQKPIKEGAIIGLAGAIGGVVLSSVALYLQTTYHFIKLSNDIYFMDYLPVQLDPIYFLFYPSCAFFITIAFSYFPAQKATKSTPAQSLRYE